MGSACWSLGPGPSTPGPKGGKTEFIRKVKETMIIHENGWIWKFGEFIAKVKKSLKIFENE